MISLFDTADLDLDPADAESVQEVSAAILRLAERRKAQITRSGPLAKSKIAWKIAVYQQAVLYRLVMLADGAVSAWNRGNILTAFLAARALAETVAVLNDFVRQLRELLNATDLKGVNELVMNRTFATRDEALLVERPEAQSVNVLTLIDKLDSTGLAGVRQHYDLMSERCHPNSMGHHQLFSTTDKSTATVTFTVAKHGQRNFHHVFAAVFLVRLVEGMMDQLDRQVLIAAELQHRLNPVSP